MHHSQNVDLEWWHFSKVFIKQQKLVHSAEQKSIGLIYCTYLLGSDMTYSCHQNSSLLLSPYLHIRGISVSSIHYNQSHHIQGVPGGMCQTSGRMFLMLKYTDITQNTYVQSWTVTEIMARGVWNFDSCYTLIDYQIHIKTGRNMWFL